MKRVLALLMLVALAAPANAVTFGGAAVSADGYLEYWYDLTFNNVKIGYLDSSDIGNWNSGEPIYLHIDVTGSTTTLLPTDVRLDSAAARPPAGDVGKTLTLTHGGTALTELLRFIDNAPAWGAGGPDDKLGVGDGLYLDLVTAGSVDVGDLRLNAFGGKAAFTFILAGDLEVTETVWAPTKESVCIDNLIVPAYTSACPGGARTISVAYLDDGATPNAYDANEHVYISSDATVSTGDIRVHHTTLAKKAVVCTGIQDADCGATLKAATTGHVSGGSTDYSAQLVTATKTLKDIVRGIDASGNGKLDTADALSWAIGGKRIPVPGDIRIIPLSGSTAGTVLAQGAGESISTATAGSWVVWYQDTNSDNAVTAGEPMVVRPAGTALAAGDVRLNANGVCTRGTQRVITDTCDNSLWKVVPAGFDTLVARGGNDAAVDAADSVYLADSTTVAAGDLKVAGTGAPKLLTASDTGDFGAGVDLGSPVYVDLDLSGSWTLGDALYADTDSNSLVNALDFRVFAPGLTAFAWVGATDADATRVGAELTGAGIQIVDVGGNGPSTDDGVFLHTAAASSTGFGHARLSFSPWGPAAGTRISGLDSDQGQAFQAGSVNYDIKYVDADSSATLSPGDSLYVSITAASSVSAKDVRLRTQGSALPGTFVITSHTDCCSTPLTTVAQKFSSLDANGNRKTDLTDLLFLDHDQDELQTATSSAWVFVSPGDFWLTGTGGASGPAPAGGGTTTTTTTTTAPPTTTVTATGTQTTTTTGTSTPQPGVSPETVASWNLGLSESLGVTRTPDGNRLTWTALQGPTGFQVFRSDSPFVEVAQLGPGATSYVDGQGTLKSSYLVTAFYHDGGDVIGFIDDPNSENIPGLGVAPEGKSVSGKQAVPGVGVVLILGVLAGLVAVRRRL